MSRRPPRFRQADVTRALRAAQQVDGKWAVEIEPDGTIRVVPVDPHAGRKRRQNSTEEAEDRRPEDFSAQLAPPRELDPKLQRTIEISRISQRIASARPQSRVQLEYKEAKRKYEEFRQGLIAQRRAQRRRGVRQPSLMDVSELASAFAALNQKLDALVEERNAIWDEAEREHLSRASK